MPRTIGPLYGGDVSGPSDRSRVSRLPDATIARLPLYLRSLAQLQADRTVVVSSEDLADSAGVNASQVRKDLSFLGPVGTRGLGYDVDSLRSKIEVELGLTEELGVVIIGYGNLGRALAGYRGFGARGFRVVALVDDDPAVRAVAPDPLPIHPLSELGRLAKEYALAIALVATPASAAQDVADAVVAAGIRSILNFAPATLNVPADVTVRKVDLAVELQILSYFRQRRPGATVG